MKAAVLREYGVPRLEDFADPAAGPGQEVVQVTAATINAVDKEIAAGTHYLSPRTLPVVCGIEGVGRMTGGRRVYFSMPTAPYGSMAERTVVDPRQTLAVPGGLDDAVAATLGNAGWAAWLPLSWRAALRPGERVLILGATGVVGRLAVQAARLLGAGQVIAAGRDPHALEETRALGADTTVRLDTATDLTAAFQQAGGPIDVIVDYTWGAPAEAALRAGGTGVRLVQVGDRAGTEITVPAQLMRSKGASIHGFMPIHAEPDLIAASYAEMAGHVLAGRLTVEVERCPLSDVEAAWHLPTRRKLVLIP